MLGCFLCDLTFAGELPGGLSRLLKKGATGGLFASANCVARKNIAGQASSGTRLSNIFGFSTGY